MSNIVRKYIFEMSSYLCHLLTFSHSHNFQRWREFSTRVLLPFPLSNHQY